MIRSIPSISSQVTFQKKNGKIAVFMKTRYIQLIEDEQKLGFAQDYPKHVQLTDFIFEHVQKLGFTSHYFCFYTSNSLLILSETGTVLLGDKNSNNDFIVPIEFDEVSFNTKYHYFEVCKKSLKGLYFYNGNMIPIEYDEVRKFPSNPSCDLYEVCKNDLKGLYNCQLNRLIIPIEYNKIERAGYSVFAVSKNGLKGAYSLYGDFIIPVEFDEIISDFSFFLHSPSALKVSKNGLVGIYSRNGDIIVPVEYHDVHVNEVKETDRYHCIYEVQRKKSGPFEVYIP